MKVLLVNGSPHAKGCTYTALSEIAKTLESEGIEAEIFHIGTKPIGGCINCGGCKKTGKCVFKDTVNDFLDLAETADGFIFGTPVYYASAAGSMSAFMDRIFVASRKGLFYLKPAAAIASARRAGTTATFDQMNKYFGISSMPIISSQYWNMVHGNKPEDVLQDVKLQFLQDVYDFHLAIHLLSAQIYLAEQALELSGRLIQKEVRQSRIDSLYRDYRFAVEDAAMADLSLDEMLQEYGRGHVANKSSL